jgi:hypothetical protein
MKVAFLFAGVAAAIGAPTVSTPSPIRCATALDCSGALGACVAGACVCAPPWSGPTCATLNVSLPAASSPTNGGLYADPSGAWTWTASPLQDDAGRWHLYVDRFTNGCGVLHYCSNGEVAHAVASNMFGPYTFSDVALAPRAGLFDSGACNDVTATRLPNGTWALFYMGAKLASPHPNCTAAYDPTEGDRGSRRIGLALAASPNGPWVRAAAPLLGPCAKAPDCWDDSDVSNPAPLFASDGSVTLLYKGRGFKGQHIGVAWAPDLGGPWTRAPAPLLQIPGEGASRSPASFHCARH